MVEAPVLNKAEPAAPDKAPVRPSLVPALILAGVGLAVAAARYVPATRDVLDSYVSLYGLPADVQMHLDDVLLVPMGSVLVVFCRVALGLRMLGPFRPILIAIAFAQTGLLLGLLFLSLVLGVVTALRPRLRGSGLPYFARLSMLLATVVVIELVVLIIGSATRSGDLVQVAFFPIIVLCLTADGFARVLSEDGLHNAIWRGGTTVAIAAAINAISYIPGVAILAFDHPELVLVEIAAIFIIGSRMNWSLLESWNPKEAP